MAQIEIKGVIGNEAGQYGFKQFVSDYAAAKGEPIRLLVDSVGGNPNEAKLISDFIQQNENNFLSVSNSGVVASAAIAPFLSLPFEKRFYNVQNGLALIHFPYLDELKGSNFTADLLSEISAQMKTLETEMSKFYAKQTGAELSVINALMSINEPLTESQLQSINFANIIKFQAVAFLNNNQSIMKKEEVQELIEKSNESFLGKIKAMFAPKPKALMVTIADGSMVNFPDVADGVAPMVGDKVVKEDGSAIPDGEIVMASGEVYVVAGGIVTEIKPKEAEVEVEVEVLDEVAQLKAELEALKSAKAQSEFDLKAQVKSQMLVIEEKEKAEKAPLQVENRLSNDFKSKFKN